QIPPLALSRQNRKDPRRDPVGCDWRRRYGWFSWRECRGVRGYPAIDRGSPLHLLARFHLFAAARYSRRRYAQPGANNHLTRAEPYSARSRPAEEGGFHALLHWKGD